MLRRKLTIRQAGVAGLEVLFAALAAVMLINLAGNLSSALAMLGAVDRTANEKKDLALRGELELEKAVHEFKDALLRGDEKYGEAFSQDVAAALLVIRRYEVAGALREREKAPLAALKQGLPGYQHAFYSIRDMRNSNATISEIDAAVKGIDRPLASAFNELESVAADGSAVRDVPFGLALRLVSYATLACLFVWLTLVSWKYGGDSLPRRERSLRYLSDRMMRWEEDKKAQAFARLHDGVCQSLSGIMYLLKSGEQFAINREKNDTNQEILEPVIPSLQAAIRDARAIAIELRPLTLRESGLLETLEALRLDYHAAASPSFQIVARVALEEKDIPSPLKPVILGIAQMTLDLAAQEFKTSRVVWALARERKQLRLSVEIEMENNRAHASAPTEINPGRSIDLADAIRARVILSGGKSEGVHDTPGGKTLVATWSSRQCR